ncbi:MAG TPA: hypothetical protein VHN36_19905 [Ilumatobacteraceae bacterium]|nr:hypothetical protein [Ilumatobacteraceae bacterium]
MTGVLDVVVDDPADGSVVGSVVGAAEPATDASADGVAAGDEEHPTKERYRQPTAANLLALQAVTATELARF